MTKLQYWGVVCRIMQLYIRKILSTSTKTCAFPTQDILKHFLTQNWWLDSYEKKGSISRLLSPSWPVQYYTDNITYLSPQRWPGNRSVNRRPWFLLIFYPRKLKYMKLTITKPNNPLLFHLTLWQCLSNGRWHLMTTKQARSKTWWNIENILFRIN